MFSRSLVFLTGALVLLAGASAGAQESTEERIFKAIDSAMDRELPRIRREIVQMVRTELRALSSSPKTLTSEAALEKYIKVPLLKKHAMTLASDDYRGRNAGYESNNRAAAYIAGEFRSIGLKPVGDQDGNGDATYLQHFTFRSFYTGGKDLKTQNVVGLMEGTDPVLKDEIVVVGGHFDHVGVGSQGRHLGRLGGATGEDEIWNGADDNGSGTTCVLSLARAFAKGKIRTKRSVLFILFSAEEAGLYGSKYYCNNPIAPISRHVYMLNLDMVGRNPTRPVEVKGVGSAKGTALENAVKGAIAKTGLNAKIEKGSDIFGGDSDHSSFKAKGIPFSFFFTGFHADYHRVSDHPEKLAYKNMVKISHTAGIILETIANGEETLQFSGKEKRGGRFNFGRERSESKPAPPRRLLGIYIESVDDGGCDELGLAKTQGALRVDRVNEGIGKDSGLEKEDVVLSLNGETLGREDPRSDLRAAIEKVNAGKKVDLVILRGEKKMTLKVGWDK